MTPFQKIIKRVAFALAIFLAVAIIGGLLSAVGLFGGFFGNDAVTDDMKTYSISSVINNLNIRINAADLYIKKGDAFIVESNLKHLKVEENGGILTILETKKIHSNYKGAVLTIYVPAETEFKFAKLITGAGRLTIDKLSSESINFELGAGEVNITTLTVSQSADIEGGAGKITISDGTLNNLDFNMGVGQLNLRTALIGECEFELGVGESNIIVLGNKDDYRLDVEKGIGNITVDGSNVSNIKDQGNGKESIEINGGIGAINIKFEKSTNNKSNELFDIAIEPYSSDDLKIITEKDRYSLTDKVIKYSITNISSEENCIAGDDDCFTLQKLVDGKWKRVGTKKEHYWNELGLIMNSNQTEQREIDLNEYFYLPLDKGTYRITVESLVSNTFEIA